MSAPTRSLLYAIGLTAVGGALFYVITPSSEKFQYKLNEEQGVLGRNRTESEQNTQALISKLQREAGLTPKEK